MVEVTASWRQGVTSVVGSVFAVSLLASCSRTQLWIGEGADAPSTWGDFAATLDVPECPSSNSVLTVNTTADELDGSQSITDPSQAGEYLSFTEAIWIAANRGTPHNIFFDADVFPAATPGVIAIRNVAVMPSSGAAVCIDGRHRGVILDYRPTDVALAACGGGGDPTVACLVALLDGSMVVGLAFRGGALQVSRGTIAGCYVEGSDWWNAIVDEAVIGPGNAFVGAGFAFPFVYDVGAGGTHMHNNYFGYDPLRRVAVETAGGGDLPLSSAVSVGSGTLVAHNVFCVYAIHTIQGAAHSSPATLEYNYVGVDGDGTVLAACTWGLTIGAHGHLRMGPGNELRGLSRPAIVFQAYSVDTDGLEITRNAITGNQEGIRLNSSAPSPPTIIQATPSVVSGDCAQSGRIEVFSDPGDQGETFLGETTCIAGVPWSVSVSTHTGLNATATLTATIDNVPRPFLQTSVFSAPLPIQ